ncbi:MAG TPA: glycosyltransferase, partial [Wenzhouxiangella sp.]
SGKGLTRLRETARHFEARIHFTVVGGGFEAMQLFGSPNIDVLLDYDKDSLPEKLCSIQPHAALFLSRVPETWNYVLSEARCLGLSVIAPCVGSFEERIEHGVTGLLYQPVGNDLITLLDGLARGEAEPPSALMNSNEPTMSVAISAYQKRIGPVKPKIDFSTHPTRPRRMLGSLDESVRVTRNLIARSDKNIEALHSTINQQAETLNRLDRTVKERTDWALHLHSELLEEKSALHARLKEQALLLDQLDRTVKERTQWALDLDQALKDRSHELEQQAQINHSLQQQLAQLDEQKRYLDALKSQLSAVEAEREAARQAHASVYTQLTHLREQHDALQDQLNQIFTSRSWRLTRPLRVSARILAAIAHRRAWHPANWIRQTKRLIHAIRVHGWRTTLEALQYHRPLDSGQPSDIEPVSAPQADDIPPEVIFDRPIPINEPVGVSIIVPVYNNLAYTAHCLASLVEHDSGQAIEIIVVNDCSSDQTADFLDRCKGIEVIHNTENLGFIGSCNAGAKKARGEFLVFLNNDTQVTEQWLTALLEPFSTWPDTGIVGARLVYPSGELQEAGGIIFKDGSGWNYGRLGSATTSRVQFVSEADYVSGACLAIRSKTFQSLGGFDTHYSPAYYEDTDLCFKVRALGLRVLYQPRATVIHFEGISSGTSESSGIKRYQAINREKFKKRWAQELTAHPEPVPGPQAIGLIEKARHHRSKGHVLVIDAVTPQPDHDSGSLRMLAILELLVEMGYRVTFMPINLAWDGRYSETLQAKGIETIYHPETASPSAWLQTYGNLLDWVIGSRYYVLDDVFSDLEKYAPQARVVFDTVDLHFLREQRKASLENDSSMAKAAQATEKLETTLMKKSHTTLVVSSVEKDLLSQKLPTSDIRVLSNIHSIEENIAPLEGRSGLMFVGGFQHPPNVDAARWLIEDILPLLRSKEPSIDLHLIGSRMPEWLQNIHAPGLYNHGFVEDLMPHLAQRKVALAPLRYGAGVKGKVNQAMAHGLPVVATSMAAEGLHTEHNVDILIADDTESFVDEIIRVYNDEALWKSLSEGGLANVSAHFSRDAAREVLEGILSEAPGG